MNPGSMFSFCSGAAAFGWLLLVFAGRLRYVSTIVCNFVIPGILSSVYLSIFVTHWAGHAGGFGSLDQVQALFGDKWLVLLGWVHFLAFDLFLGAWQVREAQRSRIRHWWTIPTLILTFLFGPIGFLTFLAVKGMHSVALGQKDNPLRVF